MYLINIWSVNMLLYDISNSDCSYSLATQEPDNGLCPLFHVSGGINIFRFTAKITHGRQYSRLKHMCKRLYHTCRFVLSFWYKNIPRNQETESHNRLWILESGMLGLCLRSAAFSPYLVNVYDFLFSNFKQRELEQGGTYLYSKHSRDREGDKDSLNPAWAR